MENYACQCFNSIEMDEKRVDALIAAGADRSGSKVKVAHNELRVIYGEMQAAGEEMAVVKGVMYVIRKCMDNVLVQHLRMMLEVEVLFGNQR